MLEHVSSTLPQILREQLQKTGVLSLTEENDNLLMWAHYADSHRGFVLEFDPKHPFFDFTAKPGKTALRPVEYGPRPKLKSIFDERIKGDFQKLFCIKSDYWAYEKEWRMIRHLESSDCPDENRDKGIHLFRFPPDCITGIVLGMNMAADTNAELLRLTHEDSRYQHAQIYCSWPSMTEDRVIVSPIIPTETLAAWKSEVKQSATAKDFEGFWSGSLILEKVTNSSGAGAGNPVSQSRIVMVINPSSLFAKITAADGSERGQTLKYTASIVENELRVTGLDGSTTKLMRIRKSEDSLSGIFASLNAEDGSAIVGRLNVSK